MRSDWATILACAVCLALAGNPISFAPSSLFAIPITHEFGWTRAQFFAGLSVATMISALVLPFVGKAVDRWGARAVILPGIVGFAASVAAISRLNGSWPLYLVLMTFFGVIVMMHGPLPYSRTVIEAAGHRRGVGLAVAISGTTIGIMLVPPLCGELIARFGWRITEITLATIVIVVAFPTALLFIGRRSRMAAVEPSDFTRVLPQPFPWQELRTAAFWTLGTAFLLNSFAVNAFLGHVAAIAVDRGQPVSVGALAVSASGLGSAAARLAAGFMLDRIQSPQVGQLWFLLALSGLLMAALGSGSSSVIIAAALVGATLGAEVELIGYFTSRFFPPNLYGRMYGLLFPWFMVGVSLGPLAFAMLFDATGDYRPGFFAAIAAQLLGCLSLAFVGPYRYELGGEPVEAYGKTAIAR